MISFCLGLIVSDGYLFYFIWNKRTKPLQRGTLKCMEEEDQGVPLKIHKDTDYHLKSKPCQFFEQLSLFVKVLLVTFCKVFCHSFKFSIVQEPVPHYFIKISIMPTRAKKHLLIQIDQRMTLQSRDHKH